MMRTILCLVLLLCILKCCSSQNSCEFSSVELNSLQALYDATNGPNWAWKDVATYGAEWEFVSSSPNPCCEAWQGITCNIDESECVEDGTLSCTVTYIDLSAYNIVGKLPREMFQLESVLGFDISHNNLYGSIPTEVVNMSSVEALSMAYNNLSFTLPRSIWSMSKLESLQLPYNELNGSISHLVGGLVSLRILDLQSNAFSGTLPPELGNNSFLESISISNPFDLRSPGLTGTIPDSLGNLIYLTYLDFDHNDLYGELSASIFCAISSLNTIRIMYNRISGTIPNCIATTNPFLETISLSYNYLNGSIPSSFGDLVSLTELDLSSNGNKDELEINVNYVSGLNGTLPSFKDCTNLEVLQLGSNNFTGTLDGTGVCSLKFLRVFDVTGNSLYGTLSPCMNSLANLNMMFMSLNFFHGSIPESYGNLSSLIFMDVSFNFLEGTLPDGIYNLPLLTFLSLSNNRFELGSIPTAIGLLSNSLEVLEMNSAGVAGALPIEFCSLSKLVEFRAINNQLIGQVPVCDTQLDLAVLSLASNRLTGPIPSEIGLLTSLTAIDLYGNSIFGTIPTTLSSSLALIDLGNNSMNGIVPSSVGLLSNLKSLYLVENNFGGKLPSTLATLVHLRYFSLAFNRFTGFIPTTICSMTRLSLLNISNNEYEGPIPSCLGTLHLLTYLLVANNKLTRTIPTSLGSLDYLLSLHLENNQITGTLPTELSELERLETFLVYNNFITGTLDGVFISTQEQLTTIDISQNNFHGDITDALVPSLLSFSATKNCFSGFSPNQLCDLQKMRILSLDGLTSGDECSFRKNYDSLKFLGGDTFFITKYIDATLPGCVFELPMLNTLSLSGNGLTGSFPEDVTAISPALRSLSLAYNRLTGTIPEYIQQWHAMINLDLSYNRLSGTIENMNYTYLNKNILNIKDANDTLDFVGSGSRTLDGDPNTYMSANLTLESNRLSGALPESIEDAQSINVLDVNLFSCYTNLPENDPNRIGYNCGSFLLDESIYFYVCCFFVVIFVPICTAIYYLTSTDTDHILVKFARNFVLVLSREWLMVKHHLKNILNYDASSFTLDFGEAALVDDLPNVKQLYNNFSYCQRFSLLIVLVSTFFFLPFFMITGYANGGKYATHTYQYSWIIAMPFLQGIAPAVIVFIVVFGLIVVAVLTSYIFETALLRLINADNSSALSASKIQDMEDSHLEEDSSDVAKPSGMIASRENFASADSSGKSVQTMITAGKSSSMFFPDEETTIYRAHRFAIFCIRCVLFLFNATVMIAANSVYVSIINQASAYKWAALAALVFVKLIWNMLAVSRLVRLEKPWARYFQLNDAKYNKFSTLTVQSVFLIFNNLVAPYIANMISDNACFSSLFVEADSFTTRSVYAACHLQRPSGNNSCIFDDYYSVATTFSPPFIYSYQCSSSFLANYIPVFVVAYVFMGIILPIFTLSVMEYLRFTYPYDEKRREELEPSLDTLNDYINGRSDIHLDNVSGVGPTERKRRTMFPALSFAVSGAGARQGRHPNSNTASGWTPMRKLRVGTFGVILNKHWPLYMLVKVNKIGLHEALRTLGNGNRKISGETLLSDASTPEVNPIHHSFHTQNISYDTDARIVKNSIASMGSASKASTDKGSIFEWHAEDSAHDLNIKYHVQNIYSNIIASFAILFTFGIAFAPLSWLLVLYMYMQIYTLKLQVKYHLNDSAPMGYKGDIQYLLNMVECKDLGKHLTHSFVWNALFSSFFIALYLLDTTANAIIASLFLSIVGVFLIWIRFGQRWYNLYYMKSETCDDSEEDQMSRSNRFSVDSDADDFDTEDLTRRSSLKMSIRRSEKQADGYIES